MWGRFPSLSGVGCHAVQSQCRASPSLPEAASSRYELACLRCGLSAARKLQAVADDTVNAVDSSSGKCPDYLVCYCTGHACLLGFNAPASPPRSHRRSSPAKCKAFCGAWPLSNWHSSPRTSETYSCRHLTVRTQPETFRRTGPRAWRPGWYSRVRPGRRWPARPYPGMGLAAA